MKEQDLRERINQLTKNKEQNSNAGCLGAMFMFFGSIFVGFANALMLAFTASVVWRWLVEPFVNYSPNFMLFLGSLMVFNIAKFKINLNDKHYKSESKDVCIIFFATMLFCLITLFYSFLFSLFV